MNDWQPIETAPKDGTPVLVVNDRGTQRVCWRDDDTPGWVFYQKYGGYSVELLNPISWMSLPAPPQETR